ncbi:NAD+ synthase [bacterium]|nr:NAD+ synthase [candidate division CSSED10-310 bacterium]
MTGYLRIALAQINCVVGDLAGNVARVLKYYRMAKDLGADVIAYPELTLTGYPPEDLLLRPRFIDDTLAALRECAARLLDITAIVGYVERSPRGLHNAAAIINNGHMADSYYKILLPNYGVFDEKRYFLPGHARKVFIHGTHRFSVNICEDIWQPGITDWQVHRAGARLIINISSSPYHAGKGAERELMLRKRAIENRVPIVYVNLVGGQDELVFDGDSMCIDAGGTVIARGNQFEEDLLVVDCPLTSEPDMPKQRKPGTDSSGHIAMRLDPPGPKGCPELPVRLEPRYEQAAEKYHALRCGLRDYARKNGFRRALIGLSGGIDSALTAVVAVDALSADQVTAVAMPSPYTSEQSVQDARTLATNLGIRLLEIPISGPMRAFDIDLAPHFEDQSADITEENIQARIRGTLLMALSNKFGYLVLSTGNKSELSVGYCTLYGDMAGGFSALKDVLKTEVYDLSEYCNRVAGWERIPRSIITKPPSAELKPDQKDSDSLPPYEELDPILTHYIVENLGIDAIIERGHDPATVRRVLRLVDQAEYKRRQGAPGIKISRLSFGKDRRMPITNAYLNGIGKKR